ncbi:M50 family metallopeptidase [Kallotenue papyrolyticum]|uniref:M50 family metallopeptidase n=1 Tax=Kallotenue papyrolyticum TaxID=1325125 RepID=UPI0012694F2D|nr:M50 family metallopeptidase [Kallotenue papyrolyticum]
MAVLDQSYRPQLHADVEVLPDSELGFILHHRTGGQNCRISKPAQSLIPFLDGQHTITELQSLLQQAVGRPVSLDQVATFITMLGHQGMLVDSEARFDAKPMQRRESCWARLMHLRIPLVQGDRFLQPLAALLRRLPAAPLKLLLALLLLNGLIAPFLLLLTSHIQLSFTPGILDTSGLMILAALIVAEIIVHEMAHGLSLTLLGGQTRDVGVGIHYFLIPYAYTNTTDAYRLSRRGRILVSLAGPMVDLSLLGINAMLLSTGILSPGANQIVIIWMSFQATILLWNANPFLPFDGYYVLADLLNEPALRREAFRYLRSLPHRLVGRAVADRHTPQQRRIYLGYGLLTAVYMMGFLSYAFLLTLAAFPISMP